MEELQIEEVENAHYSSSDDDSIDRGDDGGAGEYGGFTFDMGLASMHTYLGEVEDTQRRVSFLDGGAILNLPMFYLEGVVLFPEATLPLRVIQPRFKAAVERALNQVKAPCTIGVVRVHRHPDDFSLCFASIGTTAEIRQYRRLEDGSLNVVTRGQQRFRLRRSWVDVEGAPCAEIQIIQEDLPLRTPRDAFGQLASVSSIRSLSYPASRSKKHGHGDKDNDSESMSEASFESDLSPTELRMHQSVIDSHSGYDRINDSDGESGGCEQGHQLERSHPNEPAGPSQHSIFEKWSEKEAAGLATVHQSSLGKQSPTGEGQELAPSSKHRASRMFWPHWVFRMYDSYYLAQRAADMWKEIIGAPSMEDLVKTPDLLSFYIASKIPVSESTRQELLEIDGISYRLRREIELLECFDRVRCKTCQSVIARRSDTLVMSSDGPLGAYVNPHGFVHEVMTLYKANGLALIGRPVEEYSWFPGYAWTITTCSTCESQMGWLFTATNKNLKPRSFWGIRSSQVADDLR
ncbi:Peptidase S16 [Macleaya cordata]|uniref:Protein cereblon n=1 Tax=Macleaya cordata TaxID=56857 RepID=A0A200QPS7_MACCD|nr:Peptidase S16 [Macleaya cordata]